MPLFRFLEPIFRALRNLFGGEVKAMSDVKLLPCRNDREQEETMTIGPDGGTLRLGEHRLVLPRGAVDREVRFTATLLADQFLKVDLRANGQESYRFQRAASLTLSYGRCEPPADERRLRIFRIDAATNRVLADVGGEVSPRERTITASLESLSTYTIGIPA
jgi:hypothetical protein